MKNINFNLLQKLGLVVCLFLFTISCSFDNEDLTENQVQDYSKQTKVDNTYDKKKFVIYYADFDWGRESKKCRGFGICNYTDCWFCCVDDGTIVDCNKQTKLENTGTIIIDKVTKRGHFIIELDPSVEFQNQAIKNQEVFHVDEDIIKPNAIVHKSQYKFDKEVGRNGGYKLKVTATDR